jgi:hypothetical protein
VLRNTDLNQCQKPGIFTAYLLDTNSSSSIFSTSSDPNILHPVSCSEDESGDDTTGNQNTDEYYQLRYDRQTDTFAEVYLFSTSITVTIFSFREQIYFMKGKQITLSGDRFM